MGRKSHKQSLKMLMEYFIVKYVIFFFREIILFDFHQSHRLS